MTTEPRVVTGSATSPARRSRDAGMSLAEIIVTTGLLVVIGVIVGSVAVLTLRTTNGLQARVDNSSQGELGIAAVSKVLRTAVLPQQLEDRVCVGCESTAIVTATSTRVTFYANIGDTSIGPNRVELEVAEDPNHRGTALLWQRTRAAVSAGAGSYTYCLTCAPKSHIIARGLLWPSPGVFTYYDYDGLRITGTTLSAANLPRISSVDVVMTIQERPRDARYPSRTAVSRVRLPNIEINILTES